MEHASESIFRPYDCIQILIGKDLHALEDFLPLLGHWVLIDPSDDVRRRRRARVVAGRRDVR